MRILTELKILSETSDAVMQHTAMTDPLLELVECSKLKHIIFSDEYEVMRKLTLYFTKKYNFYIAVNVQAQRVFYNTQIYIILISIVK